MEIFLNEKLIIVDNKATAFSIKESYRPNADIVIHNGFIISEDIPLKKQDRISLIKKGEIPSYEELEALMISRHTPGVHEKIKKARVGIAGLGGLGSNASISLARIGIGYLKLIDFDIVEPSNLNRQQYFIKHLGMKKTEAMKDLISKINPFVKIETKDTYIDENNVEEIFSDVDIIVEAFDNPRSKAKLINIVLQKMPEKKIVAASGLAGYFSSNTIATKKIRENFYLIGDDVSEAKPGCGLMSPRVAIAANHQANTVLRIIMGEKDV
ncbi:sulfur carrier protein ThiS adenylyltransferase ThiF [Maledivibacter halophilus]|uniref:Sulfur carrier protein ThiS adenylyltransferase n=1 Tax=Maledivibacter halophilus TaxID=36842 RepID=A0A1T5M0S5_9FIRM|nr:sulfur carrier protein ThiS adenylyltransferase ThiF [Maledivibacter halophilus]SKC81840.1 sulfur carrier protein ThiS adenylyltransferase [Maledivibacter halophilus]